MRMIPHTSTTHPEFQGVSSPHVALAPFAETDVERLIGWIPSAEFLLQWSGSAFTHPLDRAQVLAHLERAHGPEPESLIFKAVLRDDGRAVGHGELAAIDRRNRSASLARILVGPPELRGQGIGAQIVRLLLQEGFDELGLHRLALHVFTFNQPAIRCYKKVGFRVEGVLRDARRHGEEYWDLCVMGILEQEWQARTSN
jgi:RimJ/RimL family protein N-acetyltransferase